MKKKLLLTIISALFAVSCIFGVAGCDSFSSSGSGINNKSSHRHSYIFQSDELFHWRACRVSGCDQPIVDMEAHRDKDEDGICDLPSCAQPIKDIVEIENMSMSKTSLTMFSGTEEKLEVIFEPEDVTYYMVSWSSSNERVVSVDQDGYVKALNEGSATVYATTMYNEEYTVSCAVTVIGKGSVPEVEIESITLNKSKLTLAVDDNETLTVNYVPNNASIKTVRWTSSDSSVASVDNNGKVTAHKVGKATITATTIYNMENDNVSASCEVTVKEGGSEMTGQVYVFYDIISDDYPYLDNLRTSYKGQTMTFNDDGTILAKAGNYTFTYTYVINGDEIVMTYGNTSITCYLDGDELWFIQNMSGYDIKVIFKLGNFEYVPGELADTTYVCVDFYSSLFDSRYNEMFLEVYGGGRIEFNEDCTFEYYKVLENGWIMWTGMYTFSDGEGVMYVTEAIVETNAGGDDIAAGGIPVGAFDLTIDGDKLHLTIGEMDFVFMLVNQ